MEQLREYNKKLLYNILPDHVAQHFLAQQAKKNDVSIVVQKTYLLVSKAQFPYFCCYLFVIVVPFKYQFPQCCCYLFAGTLLPVL